MKRLFYVKLFKHVGESSEAGWPGANGNLFASFGEAVTIRT